MADYSLVKDQNGDTIGVYLRNTDHAPDKNILKVLCIEQNLSDGVYAAVYSGSHPPNPAHPIIAGAAFSSGDQPHLERCSHSRQSRPEGTRQRDGGSSGSRQKAKRLR